MRADRLTRAELRKWQAAIGARSWDIWEAKEIPKFIDVHLAVNHVDGCRRSEAQTPLRLV